MRKLIGHILDFFGGRYYIVEYDAFEMEDMGLAWHRHDEPQSPYQALYLVERFGGSHAGVFRSRLAASRYLAWCSTLPGEPIYPQHITRIPRNHPLVERSYWR